MSSIIMHKSDILLDIINRIKDIKHLHSDAKVAEVLEMNRNDLYGFKKRGSLPLKQIHAFCEREGIMLEYIINGTPPVHGADPGPMPKIPGHGVGTYIGESQAPYNGAAFDNHIPAQSKPLLELTADVLSTDSVYRSALESNVKAFHDAVSARKQLAVAEAKLAQCRRDTIELKQELNEKDLLIEKLQAVISELRSAKSGTGGA